MAPKEDDMELLEKAVREPRLAESNFQQLVNRIKVLRSMGK